MTLKKLKNGSYSVVLSVVAVIVVMLLNLIVGKLPSTYTKLDVSDQKLFTVGEQTKELVDGLTEDVEIYVLTQEGAEDTTLSELLRRYDDLSDRITVEVKDPVLYPDFASKYTDVALSDNSVIVVCGDHVKAIDYYDLYVYETDYTTYKTVATEFDGEGQITSAIAYVTTQDIPVLYAIEGHQEIELTPALISTIEKENIEVKNLNLLTSEQVPEDAEILFLYAPLVDLSADETQKIRTYLQGGGRMMWITAYTDDETPNMNALMADYGLEKHNGLLLEQNANYYIPNYPNYLLPQIKNTEVTANMSGRHVLAPMAQGLKKTEEARDGLTITELLATSADAFSKADVTTTTVEVMEGDVEGPFMIGAAVTEEVTAASGESGETRLVVYSTEHLLVPEIDTMVSGGNTKLFMDSLSWMSDHEVTISVAAKSLDSGYLTVSAASAILWGLLLTLLLPASLLIGGGMVCYGRRKK